MFSDLCTDVHSAQRSTPRLTEAHEGPCAEQSAHRDRGWSWWCLDWAREEGGRPEADLVEEPRENITDVDGYN